MVAHRTRTLRTHGLILIPPPSLPGFGIMPLANRFYIVKHSGWTGDYWLTTTRDDEQAVIDLMNKNNNLRPCILPEWLYLAPTPNAAKA